MASSCVLKRLPLHLFGTPGSSPPAYSHQAFHDLTNEAQAWSRELGHFKRGGKKLRAGLHLEHVAALHHLDGRTNPRAAGLLKETLKLCSFRTFACHWGALREGKAEEASRSIACHLHFCTPNHLLSRARTCPPGHHNPELEPEPCTQTPAAGPVCKNSGEKQPGSPALALTTLGSPVLQRATLSFKFSSHFKFDAAAFLRESEEVYTKIHFLRGRTKTLNLA